MRLCSGSFGEQKKLPFYRKSRKKSAKSLESGYTKSRSVGLQDGFIVCREDQK